MAAPAAMPSLLPASSGVQFTARPALRPASQASHSKSWVEKSRPKATQLDSGASSASSETANPTLSIIEIEAKLRDRVRGRYKDIQQGFQNYDVGQTLSITRGEFRRVLESFCLPLTTEQFDAVMNKVDLNPNGTVRYCDFLDKFYGKDKSRKSENWKGAQTRYVQPPSPQEMNTDMVEKMLKGKIHENMKNVMKALRLYDYNRDGHIQRHELRKVLENYCFRMSDIQFDKLYQRYDFQHKGMLNYRDFLYQLGIAVDRQNQPPPGGLKGSLQWRDQAAPPNGKPGQILQQRPSDPRLAAMSIDQLESEFRKKMKENYINLKKMFLVFDKHLDGFVSLEDLKSILNQFTIPMSDQIFSQIMDRFGVKASGKVSWEFFLEKFQDPQSHGNGQTIPIKPNHRFFPVRGAEEKMDIKDVIRLLHQHVVQGYSSFKQAFLELDKNRDGRISRKELRKVLNTFKFRIADSQFRELMILLDPQHTNFISYHKFLDLFEEKESREAHKWLKSCHRFNDVQKPAILAWETVEELLQEKITEHWKTVSAGLQKHDPSGSGYVSSKDLRKVMERACVPLSDDHFNNLLNRLAERRDEKGRVNYVDVLTRLGVTIKPGDLEGLSTQITKGSEETEDRRNSDLQERQEMADSFTANRTVTMTSEEILTRLRDRMSQYSTQIRKSFKQYSLSGKGKVSKKDFRKVLEGLGFYMEDGQFQDLCSKLSFHKNHMTYYDFVMNFEDPRLGGPQNDLFKVNNHRVNKIRGDEYGMTAEQVEKKLLAKLRENFEDLRGAFYKFDDDHNGIVTKNNFRRMLDSFMCIMCDEEFNRFCQILGIDKKTKIGYKDFLEAFEVRDTAEGHKWLNSTHKYNKTLPMKMLTSEEVHAELANKAHQQYKDLAKAFCSMDTSSNGVISKRELRETLYKFMMPMSKEEFKKLWKCYDTRGTGVISHQEFLGQLTGEQFAPGDDRGTSEKIAENSKLTLEIHQQGQVDKQLQITQNQADRATAFKVEEVLQQLRDRIRDKYKDFQSAFKAYDKRQRGYLTSANIQKVLLDFNYFLDDDQYYDLLERLQLSKPKAKLTYEDFLRIFEEGRKDQYQPARADVHAAQVEHGQLKPDEVEAKLRNSIVKELDTIQSAFQALDPQCTGRLAVPDFRRVLDNFCFKLSESQFKHFITNFNVSKDNTLSYITFLSGFREADSQDSPKWLENLQDQAQEPSPALMSEDEVDSHIREVVTARFHAIARAMADVDYARIGVLTLDDFREIVFKFLIRLTAEQFEQLQSKLKVNEFGNVDYRDFLKRYSRGEVPRPSTSAGVPGHGRRPATGDSELGRNLCSSWSVSSSRSGRPFTPMVNAEGAEKKLKEMVYKHWKDIQKHCRACDPDNGGQISQRDFKFILGRYDMNLPEDDIQKLLIKFDLRNNGRFCYTEFLRHFVLHLKTNEESGQLLPRRKVQPTKISPPPSASPGGNEQSSVGARLHQCVSSNWKEMRRDFRNSDPHNIGVVNSEAFRQTLRNFNMNLTEDEFSQLVGHYGPNPESLINYNDFIKAFLKNT